MESTEKTVPESSLANTNWVLAGYIVVTLFAISSISSSWIRLDDAVKERVSFLLYVGGMAITYFSWIGIAYLINSVRLRIPMFSDRHPNWWLIHASISVGIGLLHLMLDTLMLWFSFSLSFNLVSAIIEKVLQWLPYEILAYWAFLGLITAISKHYSALSENVSTSNHRKQFLITKAGLTELIEAKNIEYIESYDNYVLLWQGEKRHILKETLSNLELSLDPILFYRVHRAFIVNLKEIEKVDRKDGGRINLILRNGKQLPVSRRKHSQVTQVLKKRASNA
tara:strand:+ start:1138 stop:1980 length:843 start_codon:yes stop_codon:yes gene_type:complete